MQKPLNDLSYNLLCQWNGFRNQSSEETYLERKRKKIISKSLTLTKLSKFQRFLCFARFSIIAFNQVDSWMKEAEIDYLESNKRATQNTKNIAKVNIRSTKKNFNLKITRRLLHQTQNKSSWSSTQPSKPLKSSWNSQQYTQTKVLDWKV